MQIVVEDEKFVLGLLCALHKLNEIALFKRVYSDTTERQLPAT
jgi:hypothetical protein